MKSRSIARELALLVLGQISDKSIQVLQTSSLETLLYKATNMLNQYWREGLDNCANTLEIAQAALLDSELQESDNTSIAKVRGHLNTCLKETESILNSMSSSLEFSHLLALCDQMEIKDSAMKRVKLVVEQRESIDSRLDQVMEGWRLYRLPRIDRDILRLAVVDLINLDTPAAVACNEAVDLANRYSDEQGRRMINGVLRRLQNSYTTIS